MSRFTDDTALTPLGDGTFEVRIDPGWWIVAGPNGGFIAALLVRAAEAAVAEPGKRLHSISVHYLRPPAEGPAVIDTVVERRGRSVATVTARLMQDGVLQALAVAAVAAPREALEFSETQAPDAPTPESFGELRRPGPPPIPIVERYDMIPFLGSARPDFDPASLPPPSPAVSGGWIRFAEPTTIDAAALAAITDAWFPPVFHRLPGEQMAVPTVDLTVHVRRLPADPNDWVLARFASPVAAGGYLVEDGELWDRHGNLLATSRQLAVIV